MIIGISGKKGHGKDLVARIIQELSTGKSNEEVLETLQNPYPIDRSSWKVKKFADNLKTMICTLLGCTREQLEDRDFKETPIPELGNKTPRDLMISLGTEWGREMVDPNVWSTTLFTNYKKIVGYAPGNYYCICGNCAKGFFGDKRAVRCEECSVFYPNWIVTDTRFPDEAEAIKTKGGILLRINRFPQRVIVNEHISETALDDYKDWDCVISNDGTQMDLIEKVIEFMNIFKINRWNLK